jgi:hypothetical protein
LRIEVPMPKTPAPLTAFEQTRRSWAHLLESPNEAPAVFREALDGYMAAGAPFPYAVFTPTYEGFLRRLNEKLVWCASGSVYVVERARDRVGATRIPLEEIDALEIGCILLKSWIKFSGATTSACTLQFNTVTDYLFAPILKAIRGAERAGEADRGELAKLDYLMARNMKLCYYARTGLLAGDTLRASLLQDEILRQTLGLGLTRTLCRAHIALVTGRELILIRDAPGPTRHGAVHTLIPLDRISSATLDERKPGLLTLAVCLRYGGAVEMPYTMENRSAAETLVAMLQPGADTELRAPFLLDIQRVRV